MRIRKIRAWDKDEGEMYYNVTPLFDKDGELDFLLFEHSFCGYDLIEIDIIRYLSRYGVNESGILNIDLMDFTGMKDRHGSDIYEKDVVEDLIDNELSVVEFRDGAWRLVRIKDNREQSLFGNHLNIMVIGNTKESKEVLVKLSS